MLRGLSTIYCIFPQKNTHILYLVLLKSIQADFNEVTSVLDNTTESEKYRNDEFGYAYSPTIFCISSANLASIAYQKSLWITSIDGIGQKYRYYLVISTDFDLSNPETFHTYSHFGRLLKSCDIIMASIDVSPPFSLIISNLGR